MTREDIVRMAREARLAEPSHPFNPWSASDEALARFANKVIEYFRTTTGWYVTDDANCEAAIQAAVDAEREALSKKMDATAQTCREENSDYAPFEYAAAIIRARGKK